MFTLLFFSFLHITKAISTNSFCVCQPDRPGPVCTLENKCSGFQNENQILVVNKLSTTNPQKNINLYSIINDNIRNNFNSSINFVFDVYGSPASKPVIFDFNGINKFARSPYNLNITIKIVGGEWKQAVQIIGLSSESHNHFLEPDNSLISFSAEQISILFDTPNPHSSESQAFHFDNLKLQKVVLKSKFGFPISIQAKTVLADSYSMITEYNCTVSADSISMLDDSPLFQSKSIKTIVDHLSTEKLNKKNLQANVDPKNFDYKFCLTTIKNINRAMTVGSCSMHSVVNDSLHYITVRSTEVLDILANAPENKSIQFYVVETTASDPNLFVLPLFKNPNHNIAFQSADTFDPTTLTIRSSSSPQDINSTNISLSFLSFSSVGIDKNLLEGSTQISAKASKLTFLDSDSRVKNLISDADSLSQFTGSLTVLQSMELSKTSPKKMNELAKIILSNQTTLTVSHLSNFPKVFFGKIDDYYVAFCDENADTEMRFFLQGGNVTFLIRDDQPIVPLTTMTFANLLPEYMSEDILNKNFYLNFTVDVPESGLNLEFGQDDAFPWPTLTTFSFQANHNYTEFPDVYITIKDFPTGTNITDYQYMNYYNVSIILTDPETFTPFFSGINDKWKPCPLTLPPYFDPDKCYHVGTYSINGALFNIQDKLGAIEFIENQKMLLYSDNETLENPIELPAIFKTSHMLTTTSKTVVYSVRNNEYNIDKSNYFYLVTSQPTRIRFNETFTSWPDYGNVTKIGFLHDEYDLYLSTERNETAVPTVTLSNSVTGVHYETETEPVVFEIPSSDWFYANKTNTRRGPDVHVKLQNNVNVPQQAFLADRVTFTGNNKQMTFIVLNETVATYTFEDLTLSFLNATSNWNTANFLSAQDESSAEITFKAKSLIFKNTAISQDISKYPLHMEVGSLDLDSLTTIPSTSFSSPIVVNEKFSLVDDSITRIVFSADSCQVFSGTKGTPVIQLKSKKSSTSRSLLSFSRKLAEESSDDTPSNVIKTDTDKQIVLSVNGNAVPEDFKLELPNQNSKIFLDQSWYNVQVPQSFNLELTGKPQISTDLLELPSGLATKNAVVVTRKQKLTNTLGFIIFLIISGVILLLGIILAILGKTCKPHKEELDVSSEDKEEEREVEEEMIPSEAASESNNDDYDGFDDETFAQSKSGATPAPSEQKNNNQVAQPLSYSDSSSTIPDSSTINDEPAKIKDKPAPAKEEETPKKEEKKKPSKRRNTISDDDELESISGNSD